MAIEVKDIENIGMWRDNIEKMFIDIMVTKVNKGNMDNDTFISHTWKKMLYEVKNQGKIEFKIAKTKV